MSHLLLLCAALSGAIAVMLGAFAAHGLKSRLSDHLLAVFQTGVTYQMYHAIALIALALWLKQHQSVWLTTTGWLWLAGTVLFSGSLYLLALTGQKWLGPITPLGGLLFILGWLSLAIGAFKLGVLNG